MPRHQWHKPVESLEQKVAWARRQLFALANISEREQYFAHQYGLCDETAQLINETADQSAGISYINQFVPDEILDIDPQGEENL